MAKLAVVAPYLLAAGAAALAANAVGTSISQKKTANQQKAANRAWLNFQQQKRDLYNERENANRKKATSEFEANLAQSTQAAREALIAEEEDRLARGMGATDQNLEQATADAIYSGQKSTDTNYETDLARSLAKATDEARQRMQALARVSAYGGSFGGMGTEDAIRNANTAADIGLLNTFRRGDIGTLRRYQQVEPELLQWKQSGFSKGLGIAGQLAMSLGSMGMGAAGAGAPMAAPLPPVKPPMIPGGFGVVPFGGI